MLPAFRTRLLDEIWLTPSINTNAFSRKSLTKRVLSLSDHVLYPDEAVV